MAAGFLWEEEMAGTLCKFGDALRKILAVATTSMLALIIVLVFVQVLARYVTHSSTFVLAEVSRILLIWMVFSGATLLISQRKLILIDLMHGKIGALNTGRINVAVDVITAMFLVFFALFTASLLQVVHNKTAPATGLSYAWFYSAPFVFCGIGLYFILERLVFLRLAPARVLNSKSVEVETL
jgi:TRAP-type C4-dicarboxylate transport system permease small subunit